VHKKTDKLYSENFLKKMV